MQGKNEKEISFDKRPTFLLFLVDLETHLLPHRFNNHAFNNFLLLFVSLKAIITVDILPNPF
jgi:hypothetical protein